MNQINYEELGFRCGLEIHQQLEGKKLFCNCPTLNSSKEADITVQRRLRAVAGEMGEIDIAAKHEMAKNKFFIYESNSEDTCLVDYDEEPPRELNKDSLETALKVALLLNAKPVDEIQIMRKIVVDGSNVCGFQRTALVATDGFIMTDSGRVSVPTICLEEESAQKLEDNEDFSRYKLDRLGIPLIEIATGPEIKSPEHAKECAAYLGMILRSAGVKRGIGTIRQDVNISIKGSARTEIKGFQDLRSIPKVVDNEIVRQLDILKSGKKPQKDVRKAESDFTTTFLRPIPGAARLYPETDVLPVRVDEGHISKLKTELPKLISDKIGEIEQKYGISKELAKELTDSEIFAGFTEKFPNVEPSLIANILVSVPKEIKRRFEINSGKLTNADFEEVLEFLSEGKIAKEAVIDLLVKKIKGEKIDAQELKTFSDEELTHEIKKIIMERPGLNVSAYMGLAMAKFRGKADGKKVMEIVKRVAG